MKSALAAARRHWGRTHPNPMVGAVIVENDVIVAEGSHARAGDAHAEVAALKALGRRPKPGATLYVTLEPCCTHGRTPPCTHAILDAGITKVVVAATDPNPAHAGHGYKILRDRGVSVTTGVLASESDDLNLIFNHNIVSGKPFFAMKMATTLDGRTATRNGESQWITGSESRAEVMRLRRLYPAISTGSGTVLADNPRLTSRLPEGEFCPWRIILDRSGRLIDQAHLHIFSDDHPHRTIVVIGADIDDAPLIARGVTTWRIPERRQREFFAALREKCIEYGITGVFFEPGTILAGALVEAKAVDYLYHFHAPILFADDEARGTASGPPRPALKDALRLEKTQRTLHGPDILTRGHIRFGE